MEGSDSPGADPKRADESERVEDQAQAEGHRVSKGLRDQIQALRRQVKDAQETLREHKRRADEGRSFKR